MGCEGWVFYLSVRGVLSVKLVVYVSEDIRETFKKQRIIPMATSSKDGVPNVIYVGMWYLCGYVVVGGR